MAAIGSIDQHLLQLEQRYWQAIQDGDLDALLRLTDDPCLIGGATGVARIDNQRFAAMMKSAAWRLNRFELKPGAQVQKLSEDVVAVAYKVHEELTVNGKPVSLEAADTSVWVRRNGNWVCAVHSESILGDPFGRDRAQGR